MIAFLKLKPVLLMLFCCIGLTTTSLFAQTRITGKVTSTKDNGPVEGATIRLKGNTDAVTSDTAGNYVIEVSGTGGALVVSSVGYQDLEVNIGSRSVVDILLIPSDSQLDDVVVIGYGTSRKKDLTGSISQVKSEDLKAFPTGNVLQSLNGRATGVRVMQNDGTPGRAPSIRIRGTSSILGSNEPLYVIDGFPGSPNSLQATDIESMEILKDASATAIYGSRGANGVIIITTKQGKAGRTNIDYEGSYGIQSASNLLELMNNTQWSEFYNLQATNDGLNPYFTQSQLDSIAGSPSTDWQDEVLRNAPMNLQSITVSGGGDKTRFSLSGNAFLQDGIITGSGYDRYTLRSNISHTISKMFSVSLNALLSKEITDTKPTGVGSNRGGGLLGAMITATPVLSPYTDDGKLRRLNTALPFLSNVLINPLQVIYGQSNRTVTNRQLANLAFNISPLDGLTIKITGGIQNEDSRNDSYSDIDPVFNSTGGASITSNQNISLLNENTISYIKSFGEHSISAVGGFAYQDFVSTGLNASGTGFLSNVTETYDLQGAAAQGIATSGYNKSVLLSWFGRVNYSYKNRYLATVSYRRDGSSKFSTLNKWSAFPSAAVAWRISEEKFMLPIDFISNLKLRASYGATGNNALNPYQTLYVLGSGKTVFSDVLYTSYGLGTSKPGQLKWETTNEFDAGLDIGLLNNRLNITVDYYYKKTKDLLNTVQLPASTGYVNTLQNVGAIDNKGWEFGADAVLIDREVKWNLAANISFNRNEVVKLYNDQDIFGSPFFTGPVNDYVNLLRIGQPLGIFYGYQEDGYTSTGNIQYKDNNGDGLINTLDKTYIGDPNPDFIYGLNSVVSYKGFELTIFLQGSQGNDLFNLNATQTIDLGFGLNQPTDLYYNHWTADKTDAKYPKVTRSISGNISERFVEDGSYLRVKNIQLAYNLPKSITSSWARNLQVYVSAQNYITFTDYSWYDPEINSFGSGNSINIGIDSYGYPTAKTLTFGVRCSF